MKALSTDYPDFVVGILLNNFLRFFSSWGNAFMNISARRRKVIYGTHRALAIGTTHGPLSRSWGEAGSIQQLPSHLKDRACLILSQSFLGSSVSYSYRRPDWHNGVWPGPSHHAQAMRDLYPPPPLESGAGRTTQHTQPEFTDHNR